jgi:hypothetical protein
LVAFAKSKAVKGVVFFLFEAEEALSWDVPGQSRALEKSGLPTLVLGDQPYGLRRDAALETGLQEFKTRAESVA